MAEAHEINFYPKPPPPANPRVKSYNEIQRLLAQAPAPLTHEPGLEIQAPKYNGPQKVAIQCTNRGAYQFQDTVSSEPAAGSLQGQV